MKDNIQTILNVCFAISITAFIYQNNSLKDDVETLKGYAQLDTDKAWERMDSIEDKIKINYSNFEKQNVYNEELQKVIAEMQVNIDIAFDNFEITNNNLDLAFVKIEHIQDYLTENFGKK
jgi:RNA binding exosome subunit